MLRVGQFNPQLDAAHKAHRVRCSTFITAWNPYSRLTDAAVNAFNQAQLAREIERRGLTFFPGLGIHPFNGWPGEESFLVLGLQLDEERELGIAFQQNAIMWAGADAIPQLVLLG